MEVFSKEISDFQKNGTYNYIFDEGGNLIFNRSSSNFNQTFLSIPLANVGYDDVKIKSFYTLEFTEFIPSTKVKATIQVDSEEVTTLETENQELKDKLQQLSALSDANITEAERLSIKQVILDLRIQLSQGLAERDFSNEFPYLPLTKPKQ
jgi:hypothetical protein